MSRLTLSIRSVSLCTISVALFCLMALTQDAPPPQDVPPQEVPQGRAAPPNAVAQGTVALIQLSDRIDTRTVKVGDHFHARLAESLTAEDGETLREGAKIKGHVSSVFPGFRTRILLSFDQIDTPRGWVPLIATVTGVPGEHGMRAIGEEGEIGRKGMTKEEVAEVVVVGAGRGAAEGQRAAGKRGAAQGAGNGAADAAYSALESGRDLILDKDTALEIRLDRNLLVSRR
jgi:hypothetical protein